MNLEICSKCPIYNDGLIQLGVRKTHYGNSRFVINAGKKRVLLVAEAFGENEDQQNLPLIGRAGKMLDRLLEESRLNQFDLKLDNVVKCRPIKLENGKYKNRTPTDKEINCCRPYMEETLSFNPDLIILLGGVPFKSFFPDKEVATYRGKGLLYTYNDRKIMTLPTYHPAATFYDPRTKPVLFKHLQNAATYLQESAAA